MWFVQFRGSSSIWLEHPVANGKVACSSHVYRTNVRGLITQLVEYPTLNRNVASSTLAQSTILEVPAWRNGIRAGLRNRCPKGRESSSLSVGTNL